MTDVSYEDNMQSAKVILYNLLNKCLGKKLSILEKKNKNEINELDYLKNDINKIEKLFIKNLPDLTENNNSQIKKENNQKINKKIERNLSGGDKIYQKINDRKTMQNLQRKDFSISPFQKLNKSTILRKNKLKKSETIKTGNKKSLNKIFKSTSRENIKTSKIKNIKKVSKINKTPSKKIEKNQSNNSSLITKSTENNLEIKKNIKKKSTTPDLNKNKKLLKENLEISLIHKKKDSVSNIICKDISYDELLINDNSLINLRLSSMELGIINDNYDKDNNTLHFNLDNNCFTFEEKLEMNYENIFKYLNNQDIYNLCLTNKNCFNLTMNFLMIKFTNKKEKINDEIENLKKKYDLKKINTIKNLPSFSLNNNSKRALLLLNQSSSSKLFHLKNQIPNKDIIMIYHLYLYSINPNLFKNCCDLKEIWIKICDYFNKRNINAIGFFVEKELNGKIFDKSIVNGLYNILGNNINKINPHYYQKLDKVTAIFVFIIKDILEFIGISKDKNFDPSKKIFLLYSRLENITIALEKLNIISNKF